MFPCIELILDHLRCTGTVHKAVLAADRIYLRISPGHLECMVCPRQPQSTC